ncbi:hypothetical protein Mzhil_1276 [Methanosalsum zhilinae DSM 4017]|uniref:Uncharacterized protein n=1 Tax=Methanosalsum zhilinae (strain DSM 4017 / NBRC 107636 / OCM 62 / WeN5) TaxID=679901 RepID=F7XN21_METZD|nr:hypothetical protein [Methanosalsum zhilinae]AEH61130.1 hypothetical protein Mzhil_1276 [Methanosalsum zhilinae DSM 4017]
MESNQPTDKAKFSEYCNKNRETIEILAETGVPIERAMAQAFLKLYGDD